MLESLNCTFSFSVNLYDFTGEKWKRRLRWWRRGKKKTTSCNPWIHQVNGVFDANHNSVVANTHNILLFIWAKWQYLLSLSIRHIIICFISCSFAAILFFFSFGVAVAAFFFARGLTIIFAHTSIITYYNDLLRIEEHMKLMGNIRWALCRWGRRCVMKKRPELVYGEWVCVCVELFSHFKLNEAVMWSEQFNSDQWKWNQQAIITMADQIVYFIRLDLCDSFFQHRRCLFFFFIFLRLFCYSS